MNPIQIQLDPLSLANAQNVALSGSVSALTQNLAYAAMQIDELKKKLADAEKKLSGKPSEPTP